MKNVNLNSQTNTMKKNYYIFLFFAILVVMMTKGVNAQGTPDFAWAKVLAGSNTCTPLFLDGNGSMYVAGTTSSTMTVGGVTISHIGSGGASQYLAKLDPNGNGLWVKKLSFGPNSWDKHPHKIIVDDNENIYMTGVYGVGAEVDGVSLTVPSGILFGICLVKLDSNGDLIWVKTADCNGDSGDMMLDRSHEIHFDGEGNILLTGHYKTQFSFHNEGVQLINTQSTDGLDAFRAVYDTDGNLIEAKRLGVINPNSAFFNYEYFVIDNEDNLYRYVTIENVLVKYNASGEVLFSKNLNISGAAVVDIVGIDVDPWGNIFLAGSFDNGSFTIDGTAVTSYGNSNNSDAFAAKLNTSNGDLEWIDRYEYAQCDFYTQIATDEIGNMYVVGRHQGCLGGDVYCLFIKYNNEGTKIWEEIIETGPPPSSGAPAAWVLGRNIRLAREGGNIIVSGSFKERIVFDGSTSFTDGTGNYRGFIAQYGLCNTPEPTVVASQAEFCQGDSVQLSVTTTPGYDYLWSNGDTTNTTIYVNSSGNYSVVAIQDEECYAVSEEIPITVHALPDTSVLQENISLTAVSGYTYLWIDCDNGNTPVEGAVTAVFSPEENGTYAVIVTTNEGCTDTSSCYSIKTLDLMDSEEIKNISIYPNPTSGLVTIGNVTGEVHVCVIDMQGKKIIESDGTTVDLSILSPGMYTIEVYAKEGIWVEKMIRQ